MSYVLVRKLRRIAAELQASDEKVALLRAIKSDYGIKTAPETEFELVRQLHGSLERLPPQLVKDCGVTVLGFQDLGPSREYYPNHGKYMKGALLLNTQLTEDPFLEVDIDSGNCLNKLDQTFYHELGHGWDEVHGSGKELSLASEWTGLSKWSKDPKEGLIRVVIKESGTPKVEGEYYYSPQASFVRFYAKRNPWDDWADTFSYYVGGLHSMVPEDKRAYFDKKLGRYFG